MKKKIELPEWKEDLIDNLLLSLDIMKDDIGISKGDKDFIEKAYNRMMNDIKEHVKDIEANEFDVEECIKKDDFTEDFLNELEDSDSAGSDDIDIMIRIIEKSGYETIKCDTLAEVIKFEAFKEELIANPYQFKLAI